MKKNGWVKLEGLMTPELAETVLERAQKKMGGDGRALDENQTLKNSDSWNSDADVIARLWERWDQPSKEDEFMHEIAFSRSLGETASSLIDGRDVRYYLDGVHCKLPASQGGSGTPWHQDSPYQPYDRDGAMNFWIALVDMPPEMGVMRFLNGSHKAGALGRFVHQGGDGLLAALPHVEEEFEMSPEFGLKAGDATVHYQCTVHGAPENSTDRERWTLNLDVIPGEALYTGTPYPNTEGYGLTVNEPFEVPQFPIINR
jgi:hypothetical protein